MIKTIYILSVVLLITVATFAQESGNRAYGQQRRVPAQSTGVLSDGNRGILYIEANVLMNVKPDGFVVMFGVAQTAATPDVSNAKVNDVINAFTRSLNGMGVTKSDIYVDFITQNKVYDYKTSDTTTVTEVLGGFETKKTVAVKYKDRSQLEAILGAAAKESIYDLIKVDYVVNDIPTLRKRLYDEATAVVKQKEQKYRTSFELKLTPVALSNEKYDAFYPGDLYRNYQAYETGNTYGGYNGNSRVIQQRKSSTLFYEPLDPSDFDVVVNTAGIEPMVQMTLYLRTQYAIN